MRCAIWRSGFMADTRKILVNLPSNLLEEVDDLVKEEQQNRSEFIREAMKLYLRERKKIRIREMMKKGYMEMGLINLEISEVGVEEDRLILEKYEKILAESE